MHIPAYGAVVLVKEEISSGSVDFSCLNGTTSWGQSVYVVGSTPALGSWDTTKAVKLSPSNYPTWTGNVAALPGNTTIEWKCIKRDVGPVVWQGGDNNSVTTVVGASVASSGAF